MRSPRGSQIKARVAAIEQGSNVYEGTKCAEGHTMRYVISGCCVTCQNVNAKIRRHRAERASTQGSSSNPASTVALSCLPGVSE